MKTLGIIGGIGPGSTVGRGLLDGVILGGTELPLILRDSSRNGIAFPNTTRIHCEAAVESIFSQQ